MTIEEFKVLVKGMKAAYTQPSFLPDDYSMQLWFAMLKDLDYTMAQAAIHKHICTNKFPPTIAEILEQCRSISSNDKQDWLSGWREVQKAIGKYGFYRPEEALAYLKEHDDRTALVAELLGWNNLCLSENQAVDRANFRDCYERYQTRDREWSKLPGNVQSSISALTKKFLISATTSAGG